MASEKIITRNLHKSCKQSKVRKWYESCSMIKQRWRDDFDYRGKSNSFRGCPFVSLVLSKCYYVWNKTEMVTQKRRENVRGRIDIYVKSVYITQIKLFNNHNSMTINWVRCSAIIRIIYNITFRRVCIFVQILSSRSVSIIYMKV